MIRNLEKRLLSIYYRIPIRLLQRKDGIQAVISQTLSEEIEKNTDQYASFRFRPKKMESIYPPYRSKVDLTVIVMQGPIKVEDDFTCETVKFYKKIYPDVPVIVSTWKNEKTDAIKKLLDAGAIVVQSEPPQIPGHLMINYQIRNSLAGIIKAKELGAHFVLKTRTDQRFYNVAALPFLYGLINTFPCDNSDFEKPQNKRIVCCCMEYGDMFYPYCLADFFYFGTTDELEILFSLEEDSRCKGEYAKGKTKRFISDNMLAPEVELLRSYIRSHGGDDTCSVKQYWQFIKNHLVTINKDELGLYWPKYDSRYAEHIRNGYFYPYSSHNNMRSANFDFMNWLCLYKGLLKYSENYEKYCDQEV